MEYRNFGIEYRPDDKDVTICKAGEITVYSDDDLGIITIQGAEGFVHLTKREAIAAIGAISALDWIKE